MRPLPTAIAWAVLILLLGGLAACARSAPAGLPAPRGARAATYTDPFAYCAAVGTIDAPDARYTGPRVPLTIAKGLRQALQLPDTAPLEPLLRNSFWRCMGGQVYACTVGANLPCQAKADTSRAPAQAMIEWCRQNPTAAAIPAYVTGRSTVYLWRCRAGAPEIVRQITSPDARGYLSNIWYQITPPITPRATP